MLKHLAATVILLASCALGRAADLTIPAGQTYTVSAAQSDLRLDRLSVGDNAKIHFGEGVSRWRVDAKHVSIGNNVVIDGRGGLGPNGANGATLSGVAKDCDDGATGGAGAVGGSGGNGVALVFWWGIDAFGSMQVLADGGTGGNGGNGGKGQDAGKVNRCAGPSGGAGGQAGAGGAGGKGGVFSLNYFDASGKGLPSLSDRLSVSSIGGRPGMAGTDGAGGNAAQGRFQRTSAGERWFVDGSVGVSGASAGGGTVGSAGAVEIQPIAAKSSPSWADEASSTAAADRGTVASLQQQVQALQATRATTAVPTGFDQQLQSLQEQVRKLEERVKVLEAR